MPLGAAFTPDTMKAVLNLLGGPASPAYYMAGIAPPFGMRKLGIAGPLGTILSVGGSAMLSVLTKDLVLPGRSFLTSDVPMHGTFRKMPYGHAHDTLKMTFICTDSMLERRFFDTWHDFIQSPDSHYMEYFDDYKGEIYIMKLKNSGLTKALAFQQPDLDPPLAEVGSLLSIYRIQEAYPYRIYAQELSSNQMNILTLDVEFYYTRFTTTMNEVMPLFNPHSHDAGAGLVPAVVQSIS